MPEGPEIRRAADRLAEAVAGDRLTLVWFAFPELKRWEEKLRGCRVEAIAPHGKALLTRFDNGHTLYSHNQLYGVWRVAAPGERPESARSLRVALETDRAAILLYSASDVSMWRSDQVHTHPLLARLGPDALDPGLDAEAVVARLRAARFAGRSLGALLLDQAFLAGMGNYLRSEVLFASRLRPEARARDLSEDQRRVLAEALLAVPRHSYATRGIVPASGMRAEYTVDEGRANKDDGFRFAVFDREGLPCTACGAAIQRVASAGRRLYLCPRCQA